MLGQLTIASPELDLELAIGTPAEPGAGRATISGRGQDLLGALWGRHRERVEGRGDAAVADGRLSRIELAFAGR